MPKLTIPYSEKTNIIISAPAKVLTLKAKVDSALEFAKQKEEKVLFVVNTQDDIFKINRKYSNNDNLVFGREKTTQSWYLRVICNYSFIDMELYDFDVIIFSDTQMMLFDLYQKRHKYIYYNYYSDDRLNLTELKEVYKIYREETVIDPYDWLLHYGEPTVKKLIERVDIDDSFLIENSIQYLWNVTCTKNGAEFRLPFFPQYQKSNVLLQKKKIFFCESIVSTLPFITELGLREEDTTVFMNIGKDRKKIFIIPDIMPFDFLYNWQDVLPKEDAYNQLFRKYDTVIVPPISFNQKYGQIKDTDVIVKNSIRNNWESYKKKYPESRIRFYDPKHRSKSKGHIVIVQGSENQIWQLKDKEEGDLDDYLRFIFWLHELENICEATCNSSDDYAVVILDETNLEVLKKFLKEDFFCGNIEKQISNSLEGNYKTSYSAEHIMEYMNLLDQVEILDTLKDSWVHLDFIVPQEVEKMREAFDLLVEKKYFESYSLLKPYEGKVYNRDFFNENCVFYQTVFNIYTIASMANHEMYWNLF